MLPWDNVSKTLDTLSVKLGQRRRLERLRLIEEGGIFDRHFVGNSLFRLCRPLRPGRTRPDRGIIFAWPIDANAIRFGASVSNSAHNG